MTKLVEKVSSGSVPVSHQPQGNTTTQVAQQALDHYKEAYALYSKGLYWKALPGLKKAAEGNYPPAFSKLYQIYGPSEIDSLADQKRMDQWKEKVVSHCEWFKKESTKSDDGKFDYAFSLFFGLGVQKDPKRGMDMWVALSKGGHAGSLLALGQVVNTTEDAWACYVLAAKQGNVYAMGKLADLLVEEKPQQALVWWQKAAEQGDPLSLCRLAMLYLEGKCSLEKNTKKALDLLERARKEGSSEALWRLGSLYQHGAPGLKVDMKKAVTLNLEAAKMGDRVAQLHMGNFCRTGEGLGQPNLKEAVRWYTLAAEGGIAGAQANLGACYEFGYDVPKNPEQAVYWYKQSSDRGSPSGQNNYARCLERGYGGLEQNKEEALRLFKLAAAQGDETAQASVRRMESSCVIL